MAKFSASDIADFVLHSFLAVPVAMSVGFLPEALLSQIYHHTPLEPFSPVIAATAVGLAILSSRWIGSGAAKWVWILPLLWFLFNLWDLARSWSPAWDSSSSKWSYAVKELVTPQLWIHGVSVRIACYHSIDGCNCLFANLPVPKEVFYSEEV